MTIDSDLKQNLITFPLVAAMDKEPDLQAIREQLYSVFRSLPEADHNCNQSIAITGSQPREGASIIALISALATRTDQTNTVLLLDCNLQDPKLHAYLNTGERKGLVELLEEDLELSDVLCTEELSGFHFIPAGRPVQSPSSFLNSTKFLTLLTQLKEKYRFLIVDCGSVMHAPEASILASRLTGVIMVVHSDTTNREVVSAAKRRLIDAKANVLGVILNRKKHYIPDFLYKRL